MNTKPITCAAGLALALTTPLFACSSPQADGVLVSLAPEVISSNDGTLHVHSLIVDGRVPVGKQSLHVTASYVDRNGDMHAVDEVTGDTDPSGAFDTVLEGLTWEGTGIVTVEALDKGGNPLMVDGDPVQGTATFSVLDRTPPTVTILPPTSDLHIGPGLPLQVAVQVEDEIGVSEVYLEASGELNRLRSTVVASGATQATVTFDFDIPDNARSGPTITLHAMAGDLSGNLAAAEPVTLTVDPAIAVATPQGLSGDLLTDGTQNFLDDPTALAVSPKDGLVYVTDNSGGSPCNDACIRTVDPTTGAVSPDAVTNGNGRLEGIAFDASGDHLYFSDRQNRLVEMTWNATNVRYENPVACNDWGADNPQDPMHLVFDPTLGVLVVDQNDDRVKQMATCDAAAQPTSFTNRIFDRGWGIALGAGGDIFVSDEGRGEILQVDRTNGDTTLFEQAGLDRPRGIEWLAGGTSDFADSLLIADTGDRTVSSTVGIGTTRDAVFLRNQPVDVALDGAGTLFVLTRPSAGDRGRVFIVTGF